MLNYQRVSDMSLAAAIWERRIKTTSDEVPIPFRPLGTESFFAK